MNHLVTIIYKASGKWSSEEISALLAVSAELETLPARPERLVVLNRLSSVVIGKALDRSSYSKTDVPYAKRWI